ncbi:unnamed protein product [Darwinula stevensoni]|uniref:1-phosphatidylinositol-3-phosphate 5-kinase n=1 Tax=Darwinula stevensoni TaxID=69355 RepID=A0A7R9A8X9_9CRUS|nr:unnamed protein product [Darwinula stevensoni]CAG0896870.1 unnamed protein product [Darwinula stevensoni]
MACQAADDNVTSLTEFRCLDPSGQEQEESFFSSIFQFLGFRIPTGSVPELSKEDEDLSQPSSPSTVIISSSEVESPLSARKVMQRLRSLLSENWIPNQQRQASRAYWMPDAVSRECYDCSERFTTFRRRHHCRVCGQIFCARCCGKELPGKLLGQKGNIRVCNYCYRVTSSYLNQNGSFSDASAEEGSRRETLSRNHGSITSLSSDDAVQRILTNSLKRKTSLRNQEDKFAAFLQSSTASSMPAMLPSNSAVVEEYTTDLLDDPVWLESTWMQVFLHEQPLNLRTGKRVSPLTGSEMVNRLIQAGRVQLRCQGSEVFQVFLDLGMIRACARSGKIFKDSQALYEPVPVSLREALSDTGNGVSATATLIGIPSSASSFSVDERHMNQFGNEPIPGFTSPAALSEDCVRSVLKSTTDDCFSSMDISPSFHPDKEQQMHSIFSSAYHSHEQALIHQLLEQEGLPTSWVSILSSLVHNVVDNVTPDVRHNNDDMDICQYVHVKKVPGGSKAESMVVNGVVCSKNVAHRSMIIKLIDPQVLLLGSAIMYQRDESKLVSLEPLILQEYEYLRKVVAKIMSFGADIIIVEKNVSRVAQDLLKDSGVTLIYNMKPSVMERISRSTRADIVPSIDAQIAQPDLGICHNFFIKTFSLDSGLKKTLMFYDGCAPHLGVSVILRGGTLQELKRVKRVLLFMILAAYNFKLEQSFLIDECANVPDDAVETARNKKASFQIGEDDHSERIKDQENIMEGNQDPLTAPHSKSQDGPHPCDISFCSTLSETILSLSPFQTFQPPYLETSDGKQCKLRNFFPKDLYLQMQNRTLFQSQLHEKGLIQLDSWSKTDMGNLHPFLSAKITENVKQSDGLQGLLADFRSRGGYVRQNSLDSMIRRRQCSPMEICDDGHEDLLAQGGLPNALNPYNHQKLTVLFSTFAPDSHDFCVHPRVVDMYFYGCNDIPLGGFLEWYCFRTSCLCPAKSCEVPLVEHVRRFAHDKGCIEIRIGSLDSETPVTLSGIVCWTWCRSCQEASPVVSLSQDSWSFSFAKYLELHFHGGIYQRQGSLRMCQHSIHKEHKQYFVSGQLVATFEFKPVSLWEISLPSIVLESHLSLPSRESLLESISCLLTLGHTTFDAMHGNLEALRKGLEDFQYDLELGAISHFVDEEASNPFRSQMERLQLLFTDLKLSYSESKVLQILDGLVKAKTTTCQAVLKWNSMIQEFQQMKKREEKLNRASSRAALSPVSEARKLPEQKQEEDSSGLRVDEESQTVQTVKRSESSPALPAHDADFDDTQLLQPLKSKAEEQEKKSVPARSFFGSGPSYTVSYPFPASEHYLLPLCVGPAVVIYEDEPSSMIAFLLSSKEYHVQVAEIQTGVQTGNSETDLFHMSLESNNTESSVNDSSFWSKDPKVKPGTQNGRSCTIEMQFTDHAHKFCLRAYFAAQFRQLRRSVYLAGEEAYVRSLSRCSPWLAKGGKSGSPFWKTLDDRLVLKQMKQIEIQSFLEFAPDYFQYVQESRRENKPTVLAKILGIYRVSFRTSGLSNFKIDVLVIENLFYGRVISRKFDLKGSMRNRLVKHSKVEECTVLLDENLCKMTFDDPLYIYPHSKEILSLAISRDAQFLTNQCVMDYSLLVGVDEEKRELVVGIIDYIRTYTWDKKIEGWVKSLSGQPTVVSPEIYGARFCEAMARYFFMVPDRWTGFARPIHN